MNTLQFGLLLQLAEAMKGNPRATPFHVLNQALTLRGVLAKDAGLQTLYETMKFYNEVKKKDKENYKKYLGHV